MSCLFIYFIFFFLSFLLFYYSHRGWATWEAMKKFPSWPQRKARGEGKSLWWTRIVACERRRRLLGVGTHMIKAKPSQTTSMEDILYLDLLFSSIEFPLLSILLAIVCCMFTLVFPCHWHRVYILGVRQSSFASNVTAKQSDQMTMRTRWQEYIVPKKNNQADIAVHSSFVDWTSNLNSLSYNLSYNVGKNGWNIIQEIHSENLPLVVQGAID